MNLLLFKEMGIIAVLYREIKHIILNLDGNI